MPPQLEVRMRQILTGVVAVVILMAAAAAAAQTGAPDQEPPPGPPPEPGAPPAAVPAAPAKVREVEGGPPKAIDWALGARLRGLFVPASFLEAFMTHAHSLNSFSVGLDATRRKGNLDMVIGMDVGWYGNFKDANWTNEEPYDGNTYLLHFKNFTFISFDINWFYNWPLTSWLAIRAGGGIGVGFLGGDYYKTQAGVPPSGVPDPAYPVCSAANVNT